MEEKLKKELKTIKEQLGGTRYINHKEKRFVCKNCGKKSTSLFCNKVCFNKYYEDKIKNEPHRN
jgi:hypothetical protein